jgi:aldehyde dehydrogenase (NAD+)
MSGLRTPIVTCVIGEGGSGGALGIAVADRVLMMENAIYSVISPEGCAAILWRSRDEAGRAAEALKVTAPDLLELSVIDEIVPEPGGSAHADPEAAAKGVRNGIFMNCGQMCWAGSRLVAHKDVHDELVGTLVDMVEDYPLGSGIDDDARMGPAVSADQQAEILDYIETGKAEGATVAVGGGEPDDKDAGHFVEPTILTDVTNDMTVAREEIFGPVLSVIKVEDEAEAIQVANDSPYGLMSGIWTNDIKRGHRVADRLEYGMVSINEYPVTFPQTPFGGYKQSGYGREQGEQAIQEYTQVKNVNLNLE